MPRRSPRHQTQQGNRLLVDATVLLRPRQVKGRERLKPPRRRVGMARAEVGRGVDGIADGAVAPEDTRLPASFRYDLPHTYPLVC